MPPERTARGLKELAGFDNEARPIVPAVPFQEENAATLEFLAARLHYPGEITQAPSLWRNPDFLKLWIGQSVSEIGSRITREGLPLTAVLVLHAQPAAMGVLAALGGAAVLLFGLVAGVWVDRMPRRPILIAADLGRAALLATIPLAAAWQVLGMPQLYLVAALASVLTVFFDVAYQSCLPGLVERQQIFEGNSKLTTTATAAEIIGPGLTGFLVQTITAPLAILLDALSFVFSAAMVAWIRRPDTIRREHADEHPWRDSIAGLHFIGRNPTLRALAMRSVVAWFFFGFLGPLYVLYAIESLHLSPVQLGITIAMGGVSGTLGSLFAGRVTRKFGLGNTFLWSGVGHGLGASLIPLAQGTPLTAMGYLIASQLIGDFCFTLYFINETSLRQTVVPAEKLGRVNAAMQLATRGMLPLGALAGGFLANAIGVRSVLTIAIAGVLLSNVWLFGAPVRQLRSLAMEASGQEVL